MRLKIGKQGQTAVEASVNWTATEEFYISSFMTEL